MRENRMCFSFNTAIGYADILKRDYIFGRYILRYLSLRSSYPFLGSKEGFSFFYGSWKHSIRTMRHAMCGNCYLRRKDVSGLEFIYPNQGLTGGKNPLNLTVLHQHDMLAEICDIFGMMLNDNDGFMYFSLS